MTSYIPMTGKQSNHPCWDDDVELAYMYSFKVELRIHEMGLQTLGGGMRPVANLLCTLFPNGDEQVDPSGQVSMTDMLKAALLLLAPDIIEIDKAQMTKLFGEDTANLVYGFSPDLCMATNDDLAEFEYEHFVSASPAVQTLKTALIYIAALDVITKRGLYRAARWAENSGRLLRGMEEANEKVHLEAHLKLVQVENVLEELEK